MDHLIVLPDLGQTTSEARVLKWLKRPGEMVRRGEPLLEVETDKVDMEVESFANGFLREVLVAEGAMAAALQPVAVLTDTPDESYGAPAMSGAASGGAAAHAPGLARQAPVAAAPAARSLARGLGIGLADVTGTGANGLITSKDVERAAAGRKGRGLAAMAATVTAGKRDIPHFYAGMDVDVSLAAAWRTEWNSRHPGRHVSFNDIFVRSCGLALTDVPQMNMRWTGTAAEASLSPDIRIVAAKGGGLTFVDLFDPPLDGWEDLLAAVHHALEHPARASSGTAERLPPRLALSNLGMHGLQEFAAIIPPGSTAVLAIGAVRKQPVVRSDRVEVADVCSITLSCDHRVVDGIAAAKFLERVQHHLNSL